MTRSDISAKANERRAKVLELRKSMSLKAIAVLFGISEARVWQIEHSATKVFKNNSVPAG